MHNPWEEMIPFYIAGTLPRSDSQRFEHHLNGCDECRRSLESWRAIAGVVRAQASGQLRDLPPLSPHVLEHAAQSRRGRRYAPTTAPAGLAVRAMHRYAPISVTLVAAVVTVIFFGGLLALMVLHGSQPPKATNVGLVPTGSTPQIIVIEPSATPTTADTLVPPTPIPPTPIPPTPFVLPTHPLPVFVPPTVIPPAMPAPSSTPTQAQALIREICTVHVSEPATNLYAGPGSQYVALHTFSGGETMTALARSDNGLYQVEFSTSAATLNGWVQASYIYTSGNCDQLPTVRAADYAITPTVVSEPPAALINADNINLRGGPGTSYPIVGTASTGQRFPITAQATSGGQVWYLITLADENPAWVYGSLVLVVPNDAVIPPAATIPPAPTASPTDTPSPTPIPLMPQFGTWSQITTVANTTCADAAPGTSTQVSLTLIGNADTLTVTYADGTSFILYRSGTGLYSGGYTTDSARVSVTLTLISPVSYSGDEIATQADGCFVRSAWNGSYQGEQR